MIESGYDNCFGQGPPMDAEIIGLKTAGEQQDIHVTSKCHLSLTSSSLQGWKDNELPLKGTSGSKPSSLALPMMSTSCHKTPGMT